MSDTFPTITINGHTLPSAAIAFEFNRLARFYSEHMPEDQVRQQLPALREKAVEQAIGARLLFEEADRRDIPVTDADVDERLKSMTEEVGGPEALNNLVTKQGLSIDQLRSQIRAGRRVDLLIESIVQEAPEPTEEEVHAHFEEHREEYSRPERVLAQHILVQPADENDAAKQAAREKLEAIRTRVQEGASFDEEAAAHSDCPSGKNGGSLGWFARGMMVEDFDRAAFDLPVNELSEIIETSFGFHIIYKTEHEAATSAEFDDARERAADFLRHARRGERLSGFIDTLRAKAKIEIQPPAAS